MIKSLNVYVANLAVLNVKFHNLHWNVKGPEFEHLHLFSEAAYELFFEYYDVAAELIKMRGSFPVASLEETLKITTVKELGNKTYKTQEMLSAMKEEFEALIKLARTIHEEADEANDFTVVATMEEHIAVYEKKVWLISSMQAE